MIKRMASVIDLSQFSSLDVTTFTKTSARKFFRRIPSHLVLPVEVPEPPAGVELTKLTHAQRVYTWNRFTLEFCDVNGVEDGHTYYYIESLYNAPERNLREQLLWERRVCDDCEMPLPWCEDRYTNATPTGTVRQNDDGSDEDDEDGSDEEDTGNDLCMACAAANPSRITDLNVTLVSVDAQANQRAFETFTQFGQLFDWIPLYKNSDPRFDWDEYSCILMCGNPESSLYGRIALCTADDGAFIIRTYEPSMTLDHLLSKCAEFRCLCNGEKHNKYCNDSECQGCDECDYTLCARRLIEGLHDVRPR